MRNFMSKEGFSGLVYSNKRIFIVYLDIDYYVNHNNYYCIRSGCNNYYKFCIVRRDHTVISRTMKLIKDNLDYDTPLHPIPDCCRNIEIHNSLFVNSMVRRYYEDNKTR